MPLTYSSAKDALFATAKAVFDAQTQYSYALDVRWPGAAVGTKPDKSRLWARVSAQIITNPQASLSAANGIKFYFATGMLFIQLFCPKDGGGHLDKGIVIARALQSAYQSQPANSEIWYTNAKIVELPEAEENFPINEMVQYQYKTISNAA